jgi:flagellar motor switch protein FliN/FliY
MSSDLGSGAPVNPGDSGVQKAPFPEIDEGQEAAGPNGSDIDLVLDVPVKVSVELGRAKMQIRNLLALSYGR